MADYPAYTRKTKTPINIANLGDLLKNFPGVYIEGGTPKETTGYYSQNLENNTDKIGLTIPPGSSNIDIMDTLKHELVHKILKNTPLPVYTDYKNKFTSTLPQPWDSVKNALLNLNTMGSDFSGPANWWNFGSTNRAGNPINELPAYMSIFNNSQMPQVTPKQRDQYMSDFYNYLQSIGNSSQAEQLKSLIKGREANSIMPLKNLGDK